MGTSEWSARESETRPLIAGYAVKSLRSEDQLDFNRAIYLLFLASNFGFYVILVWGIASTPRSGSVPSISRYMADNLGIAAFVLMLLVAFCTFRFEIVTKYVVDRDRRICSEYLVASVVGFLELLFFSLTVLISLDTVPNAHYACAAIAFFFAALREILYLPLRRRGKVWVLHLSLLLAMIGSIITFGVLVNTQWEPDAGWLEYVALWTMIQFVAFHWLDYKVVAKQEP